MRSPKKMTDPDFEEPFPDPVDIEITDSIDLHAFRPQEAQAVLKAYLGEARKKGFKVVRIIHGKGIGVQRDMVRRVLEKQNFVKAIKSAPEFSGNWGATIVELET